MKSEALARLAKLVDSPFGPPQDKIDIAELLQWTHDLECKVEILRDQGAEAKKGWDEATAGWHTALLQNEALQNECDRLKREADLCHTYCGIADKRIGELEEVAEGAMASYRQECLMQDKEINEPLEERFMRVVRGKTEKR